MGVRPPPSNDDDGPEVIEFGIAVVAAFAILFGVQLLMFGVLSDLIVTLHREQMRRLE